MNPITFFEYILALGVGILTLSVFAGLALLVFGFFRGLIVKP